MIEIAKELYALRDDREKFFELAEALDGKLGVMLTDSVATGITSRTTFNSGHFQYLAWIRLAGGDACYGSATAEDVTTEMAGALAMAGAFDSLPDELRTNYSPLPEPDPLEPVIKARSQELSADVIEDLISFLAEHDCKLVAIGVPNGYLPHDVVMNAAVHGFHQPLFWLKVATPREMVTFIHVSLGQLMDEVATTIGSNVPRVAA